ncbi:unnamed protein product [Haemonchus placei]|uniref:Capsid protein n=1 Tax=Haemonchus placei TaxID=6290 RepID=A0A0N4W376_HAEPC|nr:unnamed protein product [Haemonchus placei]
MSDNEASGPTVKYVHKPEGPEGTAKEKSGIGGMDGASKRQRGSETSYEMAIFSKTHSTTAQFRVGVNLRHNSVQLVGVMSIFQSPVGATLVYNQHLPRVVTPPWLRADTKDSCKATKKMSHSNPANATINLVYKLKWWMPYQLAKKNDCLI